MLVFKFRATSITTFTRYVRGRSISSLGSALVSRYPHKAAAAGILEGSEGSEGRS